MNKWAHIALWLGEKTPQLIDELANEPRHDLTEKERLVIGKATRDVASLPEDAPAPYGFSGPMDIDLSRVWRYWFFAASLIWKHSPPGGWIKKVLNAEVFQSIDEAPIVPLQLNDLYGIQQGRQEVVLDSEHLERGLNWRELEPSDPAKKLLLAALDEMHQLAYVYSDLERGRDCYGAHLAAAICTLEKLGTQESLAKAVPDKLRTWIQQASVDYILNIFRNCAPERTPPSTSTVYRWKEGREAPTGFLKARNERALARVVKRWAEGKATAAGKRKTGRYGKADNFGKEDEEED